MSIVDQYRVREGDLNHANQFVQVCRGMLRNQSPDMNWQALANMAADSGHFQTAREFVAKAAGVDTAAWGEPEGRRLTDAYLTEVAGANLVDALKPFALPIPQNARIFLASGVIAEGAAEGQAKVVTPVDITPGDIERAKVASIVVFSDEVASSQAKDAEVLFRRLLRNAVIEASNSSLLAVLPTISVPAGSDAADSLNAGLAASVPSTAYVVGARPSLVRELALASDGRMPVGGGEFSPGITVLPVTETSSSPDMVVIPANTIALRDSGLMVRQARHATIDMADSPASPATTPVSLFQVNARALLVERIVEVLGGSPAVAVG